MTNNLTSDDEAEDTPLLQESPKNCLFECVGGDQCEDGRCCETGSVKNGNGKGTTGSSK